MQAQVVIGAGFGDEGKGRTVDYLCSKAEGRTVVTRFNGGAQAGHTVEVGRIRHAFAHYGAGTWAGADTYLSRHFIVNPLLWAEEKEQFLTPPPGTLFVDSRAALSTPYDMILNRELERRLGHGSCGAGIWETVVRCRVVEFATSAEDMYSPGSLRHLCKGIRESHVPARWAEMTRDAAMPDSMKRLLRSDRLLDDYILSVADLAVEASLREADALEEYETVVFEGAQGLLLDQDRTDFFPHVTGSSTGLKNVEDICKEAGITAARVFYTTRAYMTRHGAGPFPSEVPGLQYPDATNRPNRWQGTMRFGGLDIPLLKAAIRGDLRSVELETTPRLAVTCLDQVSDSEETLDRLVRGLEIPLGLRSFGSERDDMRA